MNGTLIRDTGETRHPRLTGRDTCDADLAPIPAYVRVAKGRRTLDLCKHHFEINEADLLAAGWTVTDDRRADLDRR